MDDDIPHVQDSRPTRQPSPDAYGQAQRTPRLAGLRRFFANQQWLWERHLEQLQPWEQEQPLRWERTLTGQWRLRGRLVP